MEQALARENPGLRADEVEKVVDTFFEEIEQRLARAIEVTEATKQADGRSALDRLRARRDLLAQQATIAEAQRKAAGGLVLVTGSLYLVGAARTLLLAEPSDPPIAL